MSSANGVPRKRKSRPAVPAAAKGSDEIIRQLEEASSDRAQRYVLRLYVTGATSASTRAIEKVRAICEQHLQGRYDLEVIDIYQMPALAKDHQIVATPTLIKVLPEPLRRFIGDLSTVDRVLFGLDLRARS
jgi:circadian clock protein KaiB